MISRNKHSKQTTLKKDEVIKRFNVTESYALIVKHLKHINYIKFVCIFRWRIEEKQSENAEQIWTGSLIIGWIFFCRNF